MVLYKRKPVTPLPVPAKVDNNSEVWVMPKSGEVFTDYESYLHRFEFYNRKKFTDAVNGKSGLTFFAAVDSENNSSSDIMKIFPDALRDPILRKVQFSEISRIDELVSYVFDLFRNDYFPGEQVHVTLESGEYDGIIREKAKFPELRNPDGSIQRAAFSRYFVKVNQLGDDALLDDKHLKRGRKLFTKQNLRSFLKNSLQRDGFTGAPWLVKEALARHYRLPMDIPAHLVQRAMQSSPQPGLPRQPQGSSVFNKVNGRKGKNLTIGDFEQESSQQPSATPSQNGNHPRFPGYQTIATKVEPPKPVVVPVKYPIEDLDVPAKPNSARRPTLKFISAEDPGEGDLRMDSVGPLLEVWNTLNVHSQILFLDSFTFDDFLDALKFQSDEVQCELLDEAHCAVLKTIVNEEGTLQVTLPEMIEDEDSDEEMEDSEPATPILDAPAHATRSRASNIGVEEQNGRSSKTPDSRHRPHRASELLADRGWVERLQARDFSNGGWQTIMAGLLFQLSLNPRQKQECDRVLSRLVPLDEEPTQETVWTNYIYLDINLRISALQIITLLAVSTKTLRHYLEEMSEEQTKIRKKKLDHQKAKKECVARLSELETQKRILLPDNLPDSPKEAHPDPMDISITNIDDTMDTLGTPTSDLEDEGGRTLRRGNERKRKREEDAARREKEREDKAKAVKTGHKQSKEFTKLMRDIGNLHNEVVKHEKEIAVCDEDLREANCQRTRVLGRDRFWNRYYWFERNGMPFKGLPDSSTAHYGYANARIWVQGPDEMERLGFIDLPEEMQRSYAQVHGVTVPQRKTEEEGERSLLTANEWGYYDDPESITQLLTWFDDRGVREKALRKEMAFWQEPILEQMRTLRDSLEAVKAKHEDGEDEPVTRVSTRNKTYVDLEASGQRCLKWRNTEAIEELGHLHSEQPKPKEKKGKKDTKGVARPAPSKVSKPTTRQGTNKGK